MSEFSLNPLDREFEQSLRQLQPQMPNESADQLLFEAGRASLTGKQRPWQVMSAVLGLMLVCALVLQRGPDDLSGSSDSSTLAKEKPPVVATWSPPHDSQELGTAKPERSKFDYLALRCVVLEQGVEALPSGQGHGVHAMTVGTGFKEEEWF